MKSLRTWLDPQGENTEHWWNLESHVAVGWISQRIMFFGCFISEQVLFCYFVRKKWTDLSYHGKFVWKYLVRHSQQVHLLSIRIDPSQAANGSIWQNTNVSALLWHARDCPLCPKMNPKISPIEVFRAPQAAQLLAHCTTHGHFELHVPYLWTSQYPFRISDGQNPALHAQTQVPQQQIGWRPISISCAKTRKSSLPKRFKDHHNQFLFGQGSQAFPKDIMVGYQLTTKCRHILGVRQHPKLRATQMFLKSALWYQQLVFPLIRPKIVRSSKCPKKKGGERSRLMWKHPMSDHFWWASIKFWAELAPVDESWWYSLKFFPTTSSISTIPMSACQIVIQYGVVLEVRRQGAMQQLKRVPGAARKTRMAEFPNFL